MGIISLPKKQILILIPVLILAVSIPLGVYLSKNSQIFQPKASALCRSDNGTPIESICLEGVNMLVYEYTNNGICKLFYEATADSCSGNPSPSPSGSGSPSPSPSSTSSPSPSSSPSLSPSPSSRPKTIAVVCSVSPNQINIGGSATWRVDAEGGVRPYDISWDGTDGLHSIGDTGQVNTAAVTYALPGTKTGLVRVRDQANNEVFTDCPLLTVTGPSPSPSSSPANKPGDIDRDGDVDIFDYNLFIQDFVSGNIRADLNGDNRVNIFDYNILIQNFGR